MLNKLKQMFCKETDDEIWSRLKKLTHGRKDSDAVPPMSAQVALDELIEHFLGISYFVTDPLGAKQVNTLAVYEIEKLHRKRRADNGDQS